MKLKWVSRAGPHPTILVMPEGGEAAGVGEFIVGMQEDASLRALGGWAKVVQYPTATEAKEWAGRTKHGFSWGRFLITGDPAVIDDIKSRL